LAGGGPYMVPIQIAGASDIATISLTLTYDATVLRSPTVTQGSFMDQGNASSTFVPAVDAEAGRIDLAITRPPSASGAVGDGVLAAIPFQGGEAGSPIVAVAGVPTTTRGRALPLGFPGTTVPASQGQHKPMTQSRRWL